jgi:hypothetical protein
MLLEMGTAIGLVGLALFSGEKTTVGLSPLHLGALGCLLLIWASTFLIQVPLHQLL